MDNASDLLKLWLQKRTSNAAPVAGDSSAGHTAYMVLFLLCQVI